MRDVWNGLMLLIVLLALLFVQPAKADGYINGALGAFHNGSPSPANVKYGEVGYRTYLGPFFNQTSGGGWVQVDEGDGRASSAFISDQIGVEVDQGLVVRLATGPALISTTDTFLGGHFQFHESLFLGLKDHDWGNEIGFIYQHFSSAGLEMPNQGRDFMGIQLSF